MKYTVSLPEITKVIMTNAPQELPGDEKESPVSVYIQDCTAHIDFYIMSWHRESSCFFALVDPLPDPQVLDLEYVSFSFLRDHDLFYSVYPKKKRPRYKKIYNRILPMKYEIPS
ncbi:hypothetical protein FYJ51_10145 [Erysipelotrichaceae bacterium Oil+RF-744-GAM-WT-6]|jgi:hypothetical protein|uniref:Uncharacterized protein n=1 Tax=Stecheria intestinalis TaxID=2606630 RepID=A0A7X2TH74_9FIRM|nr:MULTISPECIES: hypothetical protein [Erysipelotrichaceae]MSS59256.1 hypothetical protein [Stecheria intestinalis]